MAWNGPLVRRVAFGLALLTAFLAAGPSRRARAGDEPKSEAKAVAWRDRKVLEARLAEACDAIEKATGAKFAKRPSVQISTGEEVGRIVREELTPLARLLGGESALEGVAQMAAASMVAKYEPRAHVIHVVPETAESMSKLLPGSDLVAEDALRAILAHEATHALDFPRFAWEKRRAALPDGEALKAFGAVVEGHAQLVAEEVAASWGLTEAFQRFTKSITAAPPLENAVVDAIARAFVAEVGFAYVQGHAFLKAVKAARGLAGVDAVLSDPPTGTRVIERPEAYLAPEAQGDALDLAAVLDAFRGLGGKDWAVRTDRLLEAALKGQLEVLPEGQRAPALAGYEDGRVLVAADPAGGSQVITVAMRWRDGAAARAFLKVERAICEAKDAAMKAGVVRITSAEYAEGAGEGGKLPGFVVTKTVVAGPTTQTVVSHIFAIESVSFEVSLVNVPGVDREAVDLATASAAATIADPAHRSPAPTLRSTPPPK